MNLKETKIWRIIWIVGIYAILILILVLVVKYKVNFEQKDFSKYLYFYNCSNKLCTTNVLQEEYYGSVKCDKDNCPYIKEINGDNIILTNNKKDFLYNYIEDKILNDEYTKYSFLSKDILLVKNNENKAGIINLSNEIIESFNYDNITSYNNNYITYEINNLYGIKKVGEDGANIKPEYKDTIYINDKIFGAKNDSEKYMIYTYDNEFASEETYNYMYSINNHIFVFKDNILDILNKDLDSTLIIKIKTKYNYLTPTEINSLNFRVEEGALLFNIINEADQKITYSFNIEKGRLNNN